MVDRYHSTLSGICLPVTGIGVKMFTGGGIWQRLNLAANIPVVYLLLRGVVMHNNAKVAGILSIISGAFGVLWLIGTIFVICVLVVFYNESYFYYHTPWEDEAFVLVAVFYIVVGGFFTLLGVLAIIGGVFSLKRRNWGLVLAGAIAGTLTFFPCGIPAIIFVAMAKPEFETGSPPIELG